MKYRATLVAIAVLLAFYACVAYPASGCGPSAEAKATAADEAYRVEHLRCVAQHETNVEIDDCRARVRSRWGITTIVRKDGGS